MGIFGKGKNKEETVLIFDIGSGSVGGAMVKIPADKNSLPVILKIIRTEIDYIHDKISVNLFTKNMIKALNITAEALYHSKIGSPDRIVCVVASPWYSSETRIIKMNKESPFIFTSKIAEELFEKEIKNIVSVYDKKAKTLYNQVEVVEHHIMDISLNGYRIESPIGIKTKSVEMNVVVSLSQKLFLEKIKKEIEKTFHQIPISFSSFIVSSYLAVRDKYISPESYLLVDVGGEVTEVGIVSKGILKSSLSFPFGKKTFFKYICTKLEIELRDASELFSLYNSGHLSAEKKSQVDSLLKSIENSWSESFRQSIDNLPHILALPETIFLTADENMINWFSRVIENEQFIQSKTIEHKCTAVSLKGLDFLKMCKIREDVICDPFLMIEAIAVMRKKI